MNELKLSFEDLENIYDEFNKLVKLKYDVEKLEFIRLSKIFNVSEEEIKGKEMIENTPGFLKIQLKGDEHYYSGEIWLNNYILGKGRIFIHLVPSKWKHENYFDPKNYEMDKKRFELEKELTSIIDNLV